MVENTYTPDDALKDWAANEINKRTKNKYVYNKPTNYTGADVVSVTFDGFVSCYSSYTCDYGVEADVVTSDGKKYHNISTWDGALEGIAEYMEAEENMRIAHAQWHGWNRGE